MDWKIITSSLPGFVRVQRTGTPNIESYRAMWDDICSQPFWKPGTNILFDNRSLDAVGSAGYEITTHAAEYFHSKVDIIGDGKIAIIIGPVENLQYGYQFNYQIGDTVQRLAFFLDEDMALEWLGGEARAQRT